MYQPLELPFTAGADLSSATAAEGYALKRSGANVVLAADGTISGGEIHVGILKQGGGNTSGGRVTVVTHGKCRAKCGGVLTRGTHSLLTTNASGELVAATTGDMVIARWIDDGSDAAAADGDWIDVLVDIHPYPTGTLAGGTGATDNVILRANGVGGNTVQGGGVATLSDTGVIGAATGLALGAAAPDASAIADFTSTTLGVAIPRMTTAQVNAIAAPIDGLLAYDTTLDVEMLRANAAWRPQAMGPANVTSTDNALARWDGATGIAIQNSDATLSDAGVLTVAGGIVVTAGGLTVTAGNLTMSAGGATVDGRDLTVDGAIVDGLRKVTMTPGAEAANAIAVVLNVVDGNGNAVNAATRVVCQAYSPNATTITLSETGAGSQVAVSGATVAPCIIVDTDASGDATVTIAYADAGVVAFIATVAPASGASVHGFPVSRDITFA